MKTQPRFRLERRALLRAAAAAGLASLVATPLHATSAAFDLNALAALLAQRKSAEARFVEERFVAGIDTPLRSSGTLSFSAPSRFVRTTLAPRPEVMAVEGNEVTLQRGGRTRRMALDAVPEATALLEAIRGTLNGDVAALRRHYEAAVEGNAARWVLKLKPLGQRLGTQVRTLELEGTGADLRHVELTLSGGDRSVMTIEPIVK
jgi:outer membrane lipoprotein-sorting protein